MWGDLFSGIGSFFNMLLPAANLAGNIYSTFFAPQPSYQAPPQPQYVPPPPPPMPEYQPFVMPEFPRYEPPDYAALLASIPRPTTPAPDPAVIRAQALGARSNLQSRGLYSGGAVTPESLAALLGIDDPDMIYQALGQSNTPTEGMVV